LSSFQCFKRCVIWSFPPRVVAILLTSVHANETRKQQNRYPYSYFATCKSSPFLKF
jgi:hypothetical protein